MGATSESSWSGGIGWSGAGSVVVVFITGDWPCGAGAVGAVVWPNEINALLHKMVTTLQNTLMAGLGL